MFFAARTGSDASIRAPDRSQSTASVDREMVMNACDVIRPVRMTLALLVAAAALAGPAAAQTAVRFALDGRFEGPSAMFAVGLDRGYFKQAGLDVSVDTVIGAPDPISRIASGAADVAFADINAMIKFRDQNSNAPLK